MVTSQYLNSIRLNNIGVSLLQRRSFGLAMVTFRDALRILRACCPRDQSLPVAGGQEDLSEVLFQRALERVENVVVDPLDVIVSHVSFDEVECDIDMVSTLLRSPLHEFVFMALQINEDAELEHDMNAESAIILHNFALANVCVAKLQGTERNLSSAVYLWRCATKVLANSIAEEIVGSYEEENLLFLWGLLLRNLTTVLQTLGEIESSQEYARALTLVFRPVDDLSLFPADAVAAPAA